MPYPIILLLKETSSRNLLGVDYVSEARNIIMKYLHLLVLVLFGTISYAQSGVEGVWEAIDDKDNMPSSHIKIEVNNGVLTGSVVKLYDVEPDILCTSCKGAKKDQPVIGMEIIYDMKEDDGTWEGGRVMDPEDGKVYKCKLYLKDNDTMKLRGYIGIPALGRTQTWYRVG